MKNIPATIKFEIIDFIIDLQKGLIEDERWDFDLDECKWEAYQQSFLDPTHLRTTLSIWLNHLRLNEEDEIENSDDARFRAFQYFRAYFDHGYTFKPPFESWELEEPDFKGRI